MKKVIIGIHGLENKPSKRLLEEWWKLAMLEGLAAIGKKTALPHFELVYWADLIYDKPLDANIADPDNPYYLDEIYTPSTRWFIPPKYGLRIKAVEFIVKQLKRFFLNADLSLKNGGIAQKLIQRYFRELDIYYKEPCNDPNCEQCNARKTMVERLESVLKKHRHNDIMLIAHSMGSIIAFDTLSSELPEVKINTFVTMGSPLGQPIVMGKIAEKQNISKNGTHLLHTPPAIKKSWYNFSDIRDVVALNHKLSAEFGPNEYGIKPKDVLVFNNYVMHNKKNPHKSFGYLRAKEFSDILYKFIIEEKKPAIFNVFNRIRHLK